MVKRLSIKRIALLIVMSIVLMMTTTVFASAASFDTTTYNVQVNVKEDASAYVTEEIRVLVTGSMHGIYRYIPLKQKITYTDDAGEKIKTVNNPIRIEDISVANDPFETYAESGNQVIQIGDENTYLDKNVYKKYSLSYKVRMYDDQLEEYDSFYFNVIPTDWETGIEKANVTVVMPKEFNEEDLSVVAGSAGSVYSEGVKWSVSGNTINIETTVPLGRKEGITVALKLPEGYFDSPLSTGMWAFVIAGLAVVLAVIMMLLWVRFGRDRKVVKTIEFEAPDDITSAEAGYIIDGYVDKEDVISIIFQFAQNGYISIEQLDEQGRDFLLRKERELPNDAKRYEKAFLYGLFAQGDGESVCISEIDHTFARTFEATKGLIESSFKNSREKRIFPMNISLMTVVDAVLTLVGGIAIGTFASMMYGGDSPSILFALASILAIVAGIIGRSATDRAFSQTKGKHISKEVFGIILLAAAIVAELIVTSLMLGRIWLAIPVALLFISCYFSIRFMQTRTKYGAEVMGKLLGFREFIKTAEKEKLEALIEENPSYFYDVLPYAYVFGLTKKWAKKFENIPTQEPNWYAGYGYGYGFNTWMFYHSFNGCVNNISSHVNIPQPSTSGSGSSFGGGGGGGASGGGFGGGGGGSW